MKRAGRFWKIGLVALVVLGLVILGVRILLPRPRFAFLGDHEPLVKARASQMGVLMETYSFQGRLDSIVADAKRELTPEGYVFSWLNPKRAGGSFEVPVAKGLFPDRMVDILRGRTTGKLDLQGALSIDKDPTWVTVNVYYPDSLPAWLRDLVGGS